jgi:3',5'-cyclic-AMP phosphodiesterase
VSAQASPSQIPSAKVLIAQISDLHIKPPGVLAYRQVDTAAALTRCIRELNRLKPRPDLVVISGDLVDTPSREAYLHLVRLLAPLEIPFAAVPGNHDDRAQMRAAGLRGSSYARVIGPLNSARTNGDVDVILIDSTVPDADHGELDPATLAWLDATLGTSAKRPALLFLHHPPFVTGIAGMDAQNLRNAGDLAAILRKHERARLVASGHVHRAVVTTFAGASATICPAPNHAVALDLGPRAAPGFKIEPPAFHLHAWFPGQSSTGQGLSGQDFGTVVTHWVPIGEFDGPYPFFDSGGNLI